MTMDPFSGHIKTWVGGINFDYFQYDHVQQSKRQPGSTFKAFVYAAAIDKGYSPCFKVQDRYFKVKYKEFEKGDSVEKEWAPGNATGYFSGEMMTLRYAMGRSINSVAAQMTMLLGPKTVAEFANKCGISSPLKPIPSIGLGSNDVSLFEMVGAYCTFVNEGMWNTPVIVSRIDDHGGNTIQRFTAKTQKVLSPEGAFLMVHMLKGTLQEPGGTAQALFSYNIFRGNEMGGKTGTSSNQSDGWFIGITKDLVSGVWVGAEERSIHFRTLRTGEGSKTALPIYGLYMEKLYADKSLGIREGFFPKPKFKINTKYYCPTYIPKKDTSNLETPPDPTEAELQL
jgi:penicillin-binding protein 1A